MNRNNGSVEVLVVDDEEDMCWALRKILELERARVTVALSAKAAIAAVKKQPFDMAFLDVKLPDVDGGELARQIQSVRPKTPCVLISGYLYEDDVMVRRGLEDGSVCAFISKPFDLEEVLDALRAAVQKGG